VAFGQVSLGSSKIGSLPSGGYVVRRYSSGGTAQTTGTACNTTISGSATTLSCMETNVPDGTWLYGVTPTLGNWEGVEGTRTSVPVDGTAPVTTASLSPTPNSGGWNTGNVTVTLTATDAGSGVASTTYSASGAQTITSTAYTGPFTISAAGSTTISFSSTDLAGNVETTKTKVVKIDRTAPVTSDNSATIGNAWKNTSQTVTLTANDGTGSGVAATYYTTDGSTPTINSAQGTSIILSGDAVYTIKYFSVDSAGNAETVKTAGTQIRIDKTNPTTSGSLSPTPNGAGWNNGNVQVTLAATDSGSGVASTTYSATGAQTISSTSYTGPFTISAEGTTTITFSSTDNAGNIETTKTQVVKLDTTAPALGTVTETHTGSSGNGDIKGTAGILQANSTRSADNLTLSVKIYTGTATSGTPVVSTTTAADPATGSFDYKYSLTHGTQYTVAVTQSDGAGNATTQTKTFTP
jgi:hypothetical protein